MKLIFVTFKEVIEYALIAIRRLFIKKGPETATIEANGFCVIPNFIPKKQCNDLRERLDDLIDSRSCNFWTDDIGADTRIYFAESVDSRFKDLYENDFIRKILYEYTGLSAPEGFLLAARIDAVKGNEGSGGGWHRDSPISRQFKAIIYLNDVDERQGPFQYVRNSHRKLSSILAYWRKQFKPGQYRYDDSELNNYLAASGENAELIVGRAGTLVLVDTKGIHRGAPILNGRRYAVTCYFWEGEVPKHFSQYRQ